VQPIRLKKIVYYSTGAFYFLLGNVRPRLRQQLANIQLLALVKSSDFKKLENVSLK
jgi:hypothetical protein